MKYTHRQFNTEFPNDAACLARIMELRYGKEPVCAKCGKVSQFTPIQGRRAYACSCGYHVYPCAGTVFEKSSTSLQLWFHAMYLMTSTRNGVSAKELQRQLGMTYKCAWRMGHEIRKLMAERNKLNGPMSGHVEVDETYVGGKAHGKGRGPRAGGKTIVLGMLQRGGHVKGQIVPDVKRHTLRPIIRENVQEGSTISTDELRSYAVLPNHGYEHGTVNHSAGQYVNGRFHVNGMENFWKHLKGGIRSTHIHVSRKYLQNYVEEFGFRYNNRNEPGTMFYRMLSHLAQHPKEAG
ncbi:MAG: IS1595 family transposase [Pseudomonadota bacterium]